MDSAPGHFVTIWQNGGQYFATTFTHLYRDGAEVSKTWFSERGTVRGRTRIAALPEP